MTVKMRFSTNCQRVPYALIALAVRASRLRGSRERLFRTLRHVNAKLEQNAKSAIEQTLPT